MYMCTLNHIPSPITRELCAHNTDTQTGHDDQPRRALEHRVQTI